LRFDGYTARPVGRPARAAPAHSGRRFVALSVLSVLVLWGALYLAFRDWRARFRARAAFGATQVATAVDPFAEVIPPSTDPSAWRHAVAETRAMLVTLTGSNLLSLREMKALRAELAARAARARPETARAELAAVWDDMEARARPTIARHTRPELLRKDSPPRHKDTKKNSEEIPFVSLCLCGESHPSRYGSRTTLGAPMSMTATSPV
jgi:hypothetical protein